MKFMILSLTFLISFSINISSQIIQTSGPVGGRFTHIALFQKSWTEISAGPHHVLAIDIEGHLWGWGRNDYGQIDGKFPSIVYEPTLIDSNRKWFSVAAGGLHSLGVDSEGNLYSWGNGERGQIGQGSKIQISSFTRIDTLSIDGNRKIGANNTKFIKVKAGYYHSVALADIKTQTGYIYGFGDNFESRALGLPWLTSYYYPEQIDGYAQGYINISCGNDNSFGIKEDGSLWAFGLNNKGQLGNGTTKVGGDTLQKIGNDLDWWEISAGINHTIALKNDSTMWGWGQNEFYQLGDGGKTDKLTPKKLNNKKWKTISAGNFFTLAIDDMDSLFVWGANHKGQLGTGNTYNYNTPKFIDIINNQISAGYDYSIVSRKYGELFGFGDNESGKAGLGDAISNDSNWVQIKSSNYLIWALNESYDDRVYVSRDKGYIWNWEKINKGHESSGPSFVSILKYFKGELYTDGGPWKSSDLGNTWLVGSDTLEIKFKAILGISDYGYTSALVQRNEYPDLLIERNSVYRVGQSGQPENFSIGDLRKIKTFENAIPFYGDRAYLGVDPFYTSDKSRIYSASYSSLYNAQAALKGGVSGLVSDFAEKGDSILVATTHGLFKGFSDFKQITDTSKYYNFSGLEYNKDFGIATSNGLGIFKLDDNLNLTQVQTKMQHITDFTSIGKILYVSTLGGGIYKTLNSGETWQETSEGLNETEVFNIENVNNDLFAITNRNQYKYENNKWALQKGFDLDSISIKSEWSNWGYYRVKFVNKVLDKTIIIVELDEKRGTIENFRTRIVIKPEASDAFEIKNLPEDLLNSQTYSISLQNSSIVLASSGGVFIGENFGETWTKITTPKLFGEVITNEGVQYARIPQNNYDEMDSLIFISKDNGNTWEIFSKGLPNKTTYKGCSKIYISGDAIFAIIENKVWYSPANSSNWKQFDENSEDINEDIKFTSVYEFDGALYLGSEAHSVWKAQLAPILLSPADSSYNLSLTNIDFKWFEFNEVQLYEFQLSSDYNFNNILQQEQTSSIEIELYKTLNLASRYFWRVRLKNSEGLWSPWSAIFVFATEFPQMTVKLSPAANKINRTMVQPFYFDDNQNTNRWVYQLQTADDANFSNNVVNHYYDTLFFFHTFEKGKNYYYRIRQFDSTIGFGGKWYPESNYHLLAVAPIQIDFSPQRDVFSFGNYLGLLWQPDHYNKFDYSQFPGLEGTPKSWYPSYHDFYAAFGWVNHWVQCCCQRRYILFGPKKCKDIFQYSTISKWYEALGDWEYSWGGSCLGFSFHSIERWLKNERPYSYQIPFSDDIQRKINQQVQYYISKSYFHSKSTMTPINAVNHLKNILSSGNKNTLPVMNLWAGRGGHAIVPYMITSGAQYDSIWVYDNWYHFTPDLDSIEFTNKFVLVNKSNGHWHFPNGFPKEGGWHATNIEFVTASSLVYSTPVLKVNKNKDEIQSKKKRGEFLLSSNDSLPATTIFVNNPDGFIIKDSRGKELSLNDFNSLDSSNIHIIKMFGGLKEQPTLKIVGAHIFADDEKSEYSIEKINSNSNDTASINIFGLGYDGEVKWKGGNDSKVSVIISDINHGINLKSEKHNEIIDFFVVKLDEELDYQKSIKIDKTALGDNEEFFAGFSPDSKEFRITNNGENKEYDIVVDLGIEVPLTGVKFGSKDTHIYRLEGIEENDTTRLTVHIDRSASGKSDTTIVYDGRLDSTTFVAEWYNSKEVKTTKVDIYPNPVRDDLTLKLLLSKSNLIGIRIIDAQGKEVKTVINDFRAMGEYIISTDIRELSQGLYFLTITTPEQVISESFLIIK